LYWERLYTMVPPGYEFRSPLLRLMEERGVLWRAEADQYLGGRMDTSAVVKEVYSALDELDPDDLEPVPGLREEVESRLYRGKLPLIVEQHLEGLGVAQDSGAGTLYAAPKVLSVVLSVTSRHLAPALEWEHGGRVDICTNRESAVRQAVGAIGRQATPGWRIQVAEGLPLPVEGTDPELLLDFRDRYRDERHELSDHLSRLAAAVSVGDDVDVRAVARGLIRAQDAMIKAGKSKRLPMVLRGLALVGSMGAATVAAAASGASVADGAAAAAGVGTVMADLGLAYSGTAVRVPDAPLTYLSEVGKAFALAD
jgi:hypothetical protein